MQIAAVFEFTGALVLGRVVTNTIAGGIADINAFSRTPEIYAYGMVCALFVGAGWQILASYMELNVSATHSISKLLACWVCLQCLLFDGLISLAALMVQVVHLATLTLRPLRK